jgi:ubiquinone/menaquinone biosynthesis C-methylase UbiE
LVLTSVTSSTLRAVATSPFTVAAVFEVTADAYARFMGRYSEQLAAGFADFAGVRSPATAVDVGCGPGALTAVLVERLGDDAVAAADPSPPFVAAARKRFPALDVRQAQAEELPFDDGAFDFVLAQLVVHFMTEPVRGLAEMARVARPGGTVAACVWDFAGRRSPLDPFWTAARDVTPGVQDETRLPGAREGHLAELLAAAGLPDAESGELAVEVPHASFEDWWEPYTLGVGPAGAHLASLSPTDRERLEQRCKELLPEAPFTTRAVALAARAVVPDRR